MSNDPRILELLDFAAAEGIELPLPVEEICALEDAGHVVNLRTGDILWNYAEAFLNSTVELTVLGEATLVVLGVDAGEVHP